VGVIGVRRSRFFVSGFAAVIATSTLFVVSPLSTSVAGAATAPRAAGYFKTLPPDAKLPSGKQCAARIHHSKWEPRPQNNTANHKVLKPAGLPNNTAFDRAWQRKYKPRITGKFQGTTDEIIQWAACKWGIDEDVVRAQAAVESFWFQRSTGDFTTDPSQCVPGHRTLGSDDVPGQCPESIGLLQVRFPFHGTAFATNDDAAVSTAYNIDYAYASWRHCFDGGDTWLNSLNPPGPRYQAGDLWGCVGLWFSGRWHDAAANMYISKVQSYLAARTWETPSFLSDS
jgi:hypothetical protein